jgi:actin-related protein
MVSWVQNRAASSISWELMEWKQVEDWEDMERIWKHVYDNELGTLPEEVSMRVLCQREPG